MTASASVGASVGTVTAPAWVQHGGASSLGSVLELWTLLPFAGLLLAIALLPLVAHRWWERNANKGIVAALFAVPIAAYLMIAHGDAGLATLVEKIEEYISFIVLLGALYVISGGI